MIDLFLSANGPPPPPPSPTSPPPAPPPPPPPPPPHTHTHTTTTPNPVFVSVSACVCVWWRGGRLLSVGPNKPNLTLEGLNLLILVFGWYQSMLIVVRNNI